MKDGEIIHGLLSEIPREKLLGALIETAENIVPEAWKKHNYPAEYKAPIRLGDFEYTINIGTTRKEPFLEVYCGDFTEEEYAHVGRREEERPIWIIDDKLDAVYQSVKAKVESFQKEKEASEKAKEEAEIRGGIRVLGMYLSEKGV